MDRSVSPARHVALLICVSALTACGSSQPKPEKAPAQSCDIQLPDLGPAAAPAAKPVDVPVSRLSLNAELDLARVRKELERSIPIRVHAARGQSIGLAGNLEYEVDRRRLSTRVKDGKLEVSAPLDANVRACKGSCYASCKPELLLTAKVPLDLNPDYSFKPSEVTIKIIKGCVVKAMGFLKVDVTPVLERSIRGQDRVVAQMIDQRMPPVKPQVERLWKALSGVHALPLGACAALRPTRIFQSPAKGSGSAAKLRFGVEATPVIETTCSQQASSVTLPRLTAKPVKKESDAYLVVEMPGRAFALGTPPQRPIDLGPGRASISTTSVPFRFRLNGEVCGDFDVVPSGMAWSEDGAAITASSVVLSAASKEAFAKAGLKAEPVSKAFTGYRLGVPVSAQGLPSMVQALTDELSDDEVRVSVRFRKTDPVSAGLRGDRLVGVIRARGELGARAK